MSSLEEIIIRINRINAALDLTKDTNLDEHVRIFTTSDGQNRYSLSIDFNKQYNVVEIQNDLYTVIHNIAFIKDHLKKAFRDKGNRPDAIDEFIEKSFEMQILIDLSDSDKHGYGSRKGGYSKRRPNLKNFVRSLSIGLKNPDDVASFAFNFGTAKIEHSGNNKVILDAEIYDQGGLRIGNFQNVVEKAIHDLEVFLKSNKMIS